MLKGFFKVPHPVNEPILNYAQEARERQLLKEALAEAELNKLIYRCILVAKRLELKKSKDQSRHMIISICWANTIRAAKQHVTNAINAALKSKT
jgi:1-pyrroline-5-carboxylate dehydrogenase